MTSESSENPQFETQDGLIEKLDIYLNYLIQVKFRTAWRPHQSAKDIQKLQDEDHKFSSLDWIQKSLLASKDFRAPKNSSGVTLFETEQAYRKFTE